MEVYVVNLVVITNNLPLPVSWDNGRWLQIETKCALVLEPKSLQNVEG